MHDGITIYCIRHGETDWNAESRYQGQADIPLNDKGRKQARRNGEVLRKFLPTIAAADFVSSPLDRTRETMTIIRNALGLPPDAYRQDPLLREVDYGHWEGKLLSDLPRLDPAGMENRQADPFNWRPEGGESYADLYERVAQWLKTVDRDTVAVTHGGISRTLRGHLLGTDMNTILDLEVPQDRILRIKVSAMKWL